MWYIYLVIYGKIHPTLMTWIIFCIAVGLSFATYWSSEKHGFLDNVCNTVDLISVFVITTVIIFFGENIRFNINTFEIICIILSLIILCFWRISKKHEVSNMFLQVVMTIAYFPTFYQLWNTSVSTESVITWGILFLASISGVATGVLGKDKLAIIYSTRSLVMVSIMIFLILRI